MKKLQLVFFAISFLSASLLKKNEIYNIEKGLQDNTLKFRKTEYKEMVKLFGKKYKFSTSWDQACFAGGGSSQTSHRHYTYFQNGVEITLSKKNSSSHFTLWAISLFKPYPHTVMGFINIGRTPFDSLSKIDEMENLDYSLNVSDTIVYAKRRCFNYTFYTKLHTILPDSLSNEKKLNLIKMLSKNSTVDSVEISRHMML